GLPLVLLHALFALRLAHAFSRASSWEDFCLRLDCERVSSIWAINPCLASRLFCRSSSSDNCTAAKVSDTRARLSNCRVAGGTFFRLGSSLGGELQPKGCKPTLKGALMSVLLLDSEFPGIRFQFYKRRTGLDGCFRVPNSWQRHVLKQELAPRT